MKTVVPTVPSIGPTSTMADPAVRRALQTLTDAHNARNGSTSSRFVTAGEVDKTTQSTSKPTSTSTTDDAADSIAALQEAIQALQSVVAIMRAHSTNDGYDAGNGAGQVAISNGTKCTNLNADLFDGLNSEDVLVGGDVVTGKTDSGNYLTVAVGGVTHYLKLYA